MSRFSLTPIPVSLKDSAQAPFQGGNWALFISRTAAVHVGEIKVTADGVGTYEDDVTSSLPVGGADLSLVLTDPLNSPNLTNLPLSILKGTNDADAASDFAGLWTPPSYVFDQSGCFQPGYATDLLPVMATTNRVRASNVATLTTGSAHGLVAGNVISIYGAGGSGYNGRNIKVVAAPTSTTFTYESVGADETSTADTTGRIAGVPGKIKAITSTATDGGGAAGMTLTDHGAGAVIAVYQLPDLSSFKLVGCIEDFDFDPPFRQPKNEPCGMKSNAFTVAGMTNEPKISFKAKARSMAENIVRVASQRCTIMAVGVKDNNLTQDRVVFTSAFVNPKFTAGSGANASMFNVEGIYRDVAIYSAP